MSLRSVLSACICVCALFAQIATSSVIKAKTAGFDYVNPLIGTVKGGHVFAGATLPFGMAKAVADVAGENQGGFGSDASAIVGFSHMHDSGTGGVTSLGNFPIFVHAGCPEDNVTKCAFAKEERMVPRVNGSVEAYPGYFAITLEGGLRAEMTVSNHTALYRFTFPEPVADNSPFSPLVLMELTDLADTPQAPVVRVNRTTGRTKVSGKFTPSFGTGSYSSFACMDFSGAKMRDVGVWSRKSASVLTRVHIDSGDGGPIGFSPRGGFVRFEAPSANRQLLVRVGVSLMSREQACENAEQEIPTFDFESTLSVAKDAWKEKLSVIKVDHHGVSEELKAVFWSGIYRNFISPQDYTGENPLWNSTEPYFDSFYCIWDSFRAQHPLLTLMDPHAQTQMIRSLIDTYRHVGKLPDCRMSLCKGWTQGGSNADVVLADAYIKGLHAGINWTTGYEAVVSDAEEVPGRWDLEGRGGLDPWRSQGFIPIDYFDTQHFGVHTRSISRTVEYAYDDFCIAQMAYGMGKLKDANKYFKRGGNWRNLYNADSTSLVAGKDSTFRGFLQPRFENGSWAYQDPQKCSFLDGLGCYLSYNGGETYEGSSWLYTFYAPGDMAALIDTLGGADEFVRRLDYFHESGLNYMGDEQAFLDVFLYHYAGRPGLSGRRAHAYIPSQFNSTVVGIPGNDDSGAMGAFAALTMMGIFPNPGQNVYFITPPFFREISVRNPSTGKTAKVRCKNFDGAYENLYVQSATLDGRPWTRSWIDHGFFLEGGVLELVLGDKESAWGTRPEDFPPSLSTVGVVNGTWDASAPSRALRPASTFRALRPFLLLLFAALLLTTLVRKHVQRGISGLFGRTGPRYTKLGGKV